MVKVLPALGLAFAFGCGLDLDFTGTRYQCGSKGECPSGLTCASDGFCGASGPDSGVGVTALLEAELTWSESPGADLDLHLKSLNSVPCASDTCYALNQSPSWDDRAAYNPRFVAGGSTWTPPEKIALGEATVGQKYQGWVFYRDGAGLPEGARVDVVSRGQSLGAFEVTLTSPGKMVHAFDFYIPFEGANPVLSAGSGSCSFTSPSDCNPSSPGSCF